MGNGVTKHNVPIHQQKELYELIKSYMESKNLEVSQLSDAQREIFEELRQKFDGPVAPTGAGGDVATARKSSIRSSSNNDTSDTARRKSSGGRKDGDTSRLSRESKGDSSSGGEAEKSEAPVSGLQLQLHKVPHEDSQAVRTSASRESLLRRHLTGLIEDGAAGGGGGHSAIESEALCVGDVVKVLDAELGMWFEGLLLAIHDSNTFDVDLQDHTITVTRDEVRRVRPWSFVELGDIVECRLPGMGAMWFRGQVIGAAPDGSTYSVSVEGDEEDEQVDGIPPQDMRKLLSHRAAAAAERRWRKAGFAVMMLRVPTGGAEGAAEEGEEKEQERGSVKPKLVLDPVLHSDLGEKLEEDLYCVLARSSVSKSFESSSSVASLNAAQHCE